MAKLADFGQSLMLDPAGVEHQVESEIHLLCYRAPIESSFRPRTSFAVCHAMNNVLHLLLPPMAFEAEAKYITVIAQLLCLKKETEPL